MRALVCLVLVACAPYYRDLENRGRVDGKAISALEAKAGQAAAAGQHAEAARYMRDVLRAIPSSGDYTYLRWADYAVAAGQRAQARAVIRWRLGVTSSSTLRAWLVKQYVEDGWIARALEESQIDHDQFQPMQSDNSYVDARFAPYPELSAALAPLLEAYRLRYANQPDQMYALFMRWQDSYGHADHRVIKELVYIVASYVKDTRHGKRYTELFTRAHALVDKEPQRALMLYSEAHRNGISIGDEPMKRAIAAFKEPAEIDPVAAQLVADGDKLVNDGELGKGLAKYRQARLRAPWWSDLRKRMVLVLEAMGAKQSAEQLY